MADSNEYRFPIRVTGLRSGGGGAVAFFNVEFGVESKTNGFVPVMVAKDFVLKRKNAGGFFFQGPAKARIRNGKHQVDAKGYKIYDPLVDLYGEKGAGQDPEKWSPTKAAFAARKQILADAEALLAALAKESAGRGSTPAGAPDSVDGGEGDLGALFGADDEMPF